MDKQHSQPGSSSEREPAEPIAPEVAEGLARWIEGDGAGGDVGSESRPTQDTRDGPPPMETMVPGFSVLEFIEQGGSASVYKAVRDGSDQPVALKVFTRPLGDSQLLWRELNIHQSLRLPNLTRLLDYGEHRGRAYLVTEFVDGAELGHHCAERSLGRRERVRLLGAVCDAVQALHERGVIHRDLKPGNVLVDSRGQPVLIDLGLAVSDALDDALTVSVEGSTIGTPAFMSPEQA